MRLRVESAGSTHVVIDEDSGRCFEVGQRELTPELVETLRGTLERAPRRTLGVTLVAFDPGRLARALRWPARLVFNPAVGLAAFATVIAGCAAHVLRPAAPGDWVIALALYLAVPFLHEAAHLAAAVAFGDVVKSCSLRLFLFVPTLAHETVAIAKGPARAVVSGAGLFLEMALWAACALAGWPVAAALGVLLLPSILLYLNPVVRSDGYYLLSDLARIPMPMESSVNFFAYLWDRARRRPTPLRFEHIGAGTRLVLAAFGAASLVFFAAMLAVLAGVALQLAGGLRANPLGAVALAWCAGAALLVAWRLALMLRAIFGPRRA